MKKMLALAAISFCCILHVKGQSIHGLSFQDIDGATVNFSSFQGSKLLIFVAPALQDDRVLKEIDSFQHVYGSKIKMIGVMSYEEGYLDSNKARIKAYYQSKGVNIVLTTGMHPLTASGSNQSALFKWLGSRALNTRLETVVKEGAYKFFIDPDGYLYAVLPPYVDLFAQPVTTNANRNF